MTSSNPFAAINLNGTGTMRGMTLALPTDRVRQLLPNGLEPGPQTVTPPGTHPVILLFNEMFRAHMSVPTLLPSLTYHEYSIGIPHAYLSTGAIQPGVPGPYYFMPKLYLDNFWATLGGIAFWGFAKEMASFLVTGDSYTVTGFDGQRIMSFAWNEDAPDDFKPIAEFPHFEPVRQMLAQPIISMAPATIGPFFILSDFDKMWSQATLRPLEGSLEVDIDFVPGFSAGRYPDADPTPGIDTSVLGCYELRTPWLLSLPYPPLFSFNR